MAKARSGSSARRDHASIARRSLSGALGVPTVSDRGRVFPARAGGNRNGFPRPLPFPAPVSLDQRLFQPTRKAYRPPTRVSGTPARVVAKKPRGSALQTTEAYVPSALLFSAPKGVATCIRRQVRREVIHATGNAGANRYRKPRSNVRC